MGSSLCSVSRSGLQVVTAGHGRSWGQAWLKCYSRGHLSDLALQEAETRRSQSKRIKADAKGPGLQLAISLPLGIDPKTFSLGHRRAAGWRGLMFPSWAAWAADSPSAGEFLVLISNHPRDPVALGSQRCSSLASPGELLNKYPSQNSPREIKSQSLGEGPGCHIL